MFATGISFLIFVFGGHKHGQYFHFGLRLVIINEKWYYNFCFLIMLLIVTTRK